MEAGSLKKDTLKREKDTLKREKDRDSYRGISTQERRARPFQYYTNQKRYSTSLTFPLFSLHHSIHIYNIPCLEQQLRPDGHDHGLAHARDARGREGLGRTHPHLAVARSDAVAVLVVQAEVPRGEARGQLQAALHVLARQPQLQG
jgi:hypothetical protein